MSRALVSFAFFPSAPLRHADVRPYFSCFSLFFWHAGFRAGGDGVTLVIWMQQGKQVMDFFLEVTNVLFVWGYKRALTGFVYGK